MLEQPGIIDFLTDRIVWDFVFIMIAICVGAFALAALGVVNLDFIGEDE